MMLFTGVQEEIVFLTHPLIVYMCVDFDTKLVSGNSVRILP